MGFEQVNKCAPKHTSRQFNTINNTCQKSCLCPHFGESRITASRQRCHSRGVSTFSIPGPLRFPDFPLPAFLTAFPSKNHEALRMKPINRLARLSPPFVDLTFQRDYSVSTLKLLLNLYSVNSLSHECTSNPSSHHCYPH